MLWANVSAKCNVNVQLILQPSTHQISYTCKYRLARVTVYRVEQILQAQTRQNTYMNNKYSLARTDKLKLKATNRIFRILEATRPFKPIRHYSRTALTITDGYSPVMYIPLYAIMDTCIYVAQYINTFYNDILSLSLNTVRAFK